MKRYGFKTKGRKCWSEMQPDRVIELLKVPKDSLLETKMRMNRKWFEARRRKFQPLFGEVQTKYVTVKPNTTECAKKVFKLMLRTLKARK